MAEAGQRANSNTHSIFGPDATARDKKKGTQAEAARPTGVSMLSIAEPAVSAKRRTGNSLEEETLRLEAWLADRVASSQNGVFTEVVSLTPTLAKILLSRNDNNRPVSKHAVEKYRRDIMVGRWSMNGQSIVVSRDGYLNDGQHRCHGVIAAGRSVTVVMVFGVERETRFSLDQNIVRTVGHYLGMNGVESGDRVGAVATYVWQYKTLNRLSRQTQDRPTKAETLGVVEHYRTIADSVHAIPGKGSLSLGGKSLLAFCHFAISQTAYDKAAVDGFFSHLVGGDGLSKGSPVLYVRNRLIESKRMTPNEKAELVFRGWNAFRRGERPKTLPILGGELPKLER